MRNFRTHEKELLDKHPTLSTGRSVVPVLLVRKGIILFSAVL